MRASQLAALRADPHYGHPKEPEVLELGTAVGQPEAWVARSTLPESSSLPGLTKAKHQCHHAKTIESCFAALGMPKEIQQPNPLYFCHFSSDTISSQQNIVCCHISLPLQGRTRLFLCQMHQVFPSTRNFMCPEMSPKRPGTRHLFPLMRQLH